MTLSLIGSPSGLRRVPPTSAIGFGGGGALLTGLFLLYTTQLSQLERAAVAVKPGDRFPEFTLTTSLGAAFSSSELKGEWAALYVFYRGDW